VIAQEDVDRALSAVPVEARTIVDPENAAWHEPAVEILEARFHRQVQVAIEMCHAERQLAGNRGRRVREVADHVLDSFRTDQRLYARK